MPRAFQFIQNLTIYDATYLVLAESLQATLLTRDVAFSKVKNHKAVVELLT